MYRTDRGFLEETKGKYVISTLQSHLRDPRYLPTSLGRPSERRLKVPWSIEEAVRTINCSSCRLIIKCNLRVIDE
jgi:hypothetical protein